MLERRDIFFIFILVIIVALIDDPVWRLLAALLALALYYYGPAMWTHCAAPSAPSPAAPLALSPEAYEDPIGQTMDKSQDPPAPPFDERAALTVEKHMFKPDETYSKCYPPILSGDILYDTPHNNFASDISNCCNVWARIGADEQTARLNLGRFKEKRGQDGWATKSADYFKKNFAYEIEEAENKRWWGNDEY